MSFSFHPEAEKELNDAISDAPSSQTELLEEQTIKF